MVQLRESLELAYPSEGCGILAGKRLENEQHVAHVLPCRNVHAEPTRKYQIAPEDLLSAQRWARSQDLQILGFYHSHPDHPAEASPTDLDQAFWPDYSYVIVEVRKGAMQRIRSFRLVMQPEKSLLEEKVELHGDAGLDGVMPGVDVPSITVAELDLMLQRGEAPLLLDLSDEENPLGGVRIAVEELGTQLDFIDRTRDVVVYCRTGAASRIAVNYLVSHGVARARSLQGGLAAWSAARPR